MIRLAECTFEEAAELARDSKAVIVLPLGAIEEHGPHLPLLVDWLGAEELARVIAPHLRRAGWRPVLAPSLPYGVSPLAEDWSGTVSLSIATLRRVVGEVIRGLARHGFRRFVLANYQADPGHLRAWQRGLGILNVANRTDGCQWGLAAPFASIPTLVCAKYLLLRIALRQVHTPANSRQ